MRGDTLPFRVLKVRLREYDCIPSLWPPLGESCPHSRLTGCMLGVEDFSPIYVFIHSFAWCFSTDTQLCPPTPQSPLLSEKALSEFAKEAGSVLQLQEGPMHNLKTEVKTQYTNNINTGGKYCPYSSFYVDETLPRVGRPLNGRG